MYLEPTSHSVDPQSGSLSNATRNYEKKLSDLLGIYADEVAFDEMCLSDLDRVVYQVNEVRPEAIGGDMIFGTTFMAPGKVGNEFFMSRGHIHARANRPETYYGESGTGLLLLESPSGDTRVLKVSPKVVVL